MHALMLTSLTFDNSPIYCHSQHLVYKLASVPLSNQVPLSAGLVHNDEIALLMEELGTADIYLTKTQDILHNYPGYDRKVRVYKASREL